MYIISFYFQSYRKVMFCLARALVGIISDKNMETNWKRIRVSFLQGSRHFYGPHALTILGRWVNVSSIFFLLFISFSLFLVIEIEFTQTDNNYNNINYQKRSSSELIEQLRWGVQRIKKRIFLKNDYLFIKNVLFIKDNKLLLFL